MKNKRLVIGWISLIFWMGLIFYMSNQPGEISSKQSGIVIKMLEIMGISLKSSIADTATFIVRKTAHFTEYFILYMLILNVLKYYMKIKKAIIFSFVLTFSYACTDEIHQYFIPGRAMAFKDVLIDSSGALLAMLISIGYLKYRKNSQDSEKVEAMI